MADTLEQNQLYQYSSISSPNRIRILRLEPGLEGEPLRGTLEDVDVDAGVDYSAVSYAWGDPEKPYKIELAPGRYVPLTVSLFDAFQNLRSMKDPLGSLTFWADQLCINQSDDSERGHQVELMRDIYAKATRVLTYIGPGGPDEHGAFDVAKGMLDFAQNSELGPRRYNEKDLIHAGVITTNDGRWRALKELVSREWSSRVWIVQESVLNDQTFIVCGNRLFRWDILPALCHFMKHDQRVGTSMLALKSDKALSHLSRLRFLRGTAREGKVPTHLLLNMLHACRLFHATDPRDKIYALLSLAKDRDVLGIVPDYTIEVPELYFLTASRILTVHKTLDILSLAGYRGPSQIPSWVADWRRDEKTDARCLLRRSGAGISYRATGTRAASISFGSDMTLVLEGGIIDRVTYAVSLDNRHLKLEQRIPILRTLSRKVHEACKNATRSDSDLALASTLVGGLEQNGDEVNVNILHGMLALFNLHETCPKGEWFKHYNDGRNKEAWKAKKFARAMYYSYAQSLAITQNGYVCLAPKQTKPNDYVAILLGGKTPYILRPNKDNFTFVGDTYVHGLMKGEALEDVNFTSSFGKIGLV
jgi:hypothetical protein